MLHRCSDCRQLYLTSSHNHLCDICGSQRQQWVERLLEVDDAVEWVELVSIIAHGEQVKPERRWWVR